METRWNTKWIVLIFVWCLRTCNAQRDWSWADQDSTAYDGFPMRSEMACEDYPISMRCPGHDVIQIVSAQYGRQNTFKCSASSSETENTNCVSAEAKSIVAEKCNNKTQCTFHVSDNNFSDPCPGTKKYLETRFNCVRYMFACPGSLTGIGREIVSTIDVRPQPGAWTKDPLFNMEHVFFAPSGKVLQEYESWEDFENGNVLTRYTLPSNMASGNIVVRDRNLYYIKANSRTIVKYSLITKSRITDSAIPGPPGNFGRRGNDISLAVDEQGLWIVYTRGKGVITFSKIDMAQLSTMKTWTINRRVSDSQYTFFICGVLYSVSSNTGRINYSYNTNLKSNQENRGLRVELGPMQQRASRKRTTTKSFLGYEAESVTYNPRDQLLYLWDAKNGNAVYFKLLLNGKDPATVTPTRRPTTPSTLSTTTSTTRQTIPTDTTKPRETTERIQETPLEYLPPEAYQPDYCASIIRNNMNWSRTKVGEEAILQCLDGQGGYATWRCVREPSMREAKWHVAGPDLTKCVVWASDIGAEYKSGLVDRAGAFKALASEISKEDQLNSKSIQVTADLVTKLFQDSTLPSQENARKIAESMADISSKIFSNEKAMESLSDDGQSKIAETLLISTEKAGFIYAETVALIPAGSRETEPLVIVSDDVLMQVEVREKTYTGITSSGVTSFPDEDTCAASDTCGSNVISIHDSDILGQKGEGPAIVVFSLYTNLGEYLLPLESDWEIDSNVISATLEAPDYQTTLSKPAVIVLKHNRTSRSPHRCVYWDHPTSSSSGNWSDAGCRLVESNDTHTTCECDHLTSFAVLVNHAGVSMEPYHDDALDIITKIGISISILCLVLCVLTFTCFRNLYNDRNTVHKHLCICLLAAETVFLFGIDQTANKIACSVVAGLLHYFFLAAFIWMALEGFQLYVMLVEVFEENSRLKWYYLAGYGIPAVVVGISAAVDHSGYGTDEVCWLQIDTGFIWSFVGPVLIVILVNLGFLAMTVYKMYVHTMAFTDSGKINSIKASVRGASVLLCLLGITWAFGILWISEEMAVLAYLFCIFNAFQGMFIFIFHCLLARKVRLEYSRCFGKLPCCQKLGRDSYVAQSSSFQKQYTRGIYGSNAGSVVQQNGQSQLRRMWNETVAPRNSESTPITAENAQNRDTTRPSSTSNRNVLHRPQINVDGNYLQEDDVFLPSDRDQRNGDVLNTQHDDLHYDRLQHHHHHHPEDCSGFHGEAQPLGRFHTGQAPKHNHRHAESREDNNARFGPKSLSHSQVQDMLIHQTSNEYPNDRSFEHNGSGSEVWESDRVQRSNRRSLDDSLGGKRDSGISLQRPPSNSRMLDLPPCERETRNPQYRRTLDNNLADGRQDEFRHPDRLQPATRNSLDDSIRQRHQPNSHRKSATLDPSAVPHCPFHNPMIIPLMGTNPRSVPLANGHRRKSISSDSDDPIVTDCSVSSASSSFGNQVLANSHHRHANESSYYEEPICHKRRLPNPAHAMCKHRGHRHNQSNISDQSRDENDIEVEQITSSDNSIDAQHGTSGHPQYRPPSPPRSGESLVSAPAGSRVAIADNSAYPSTGIAIMQHTDVYDRHNQADKRPKSSHKHGSNRQANEIADVAGRSMTNL